MAAVSVAAAQLAAPSAQAQNAYLQQNLVSDIAGLAVTMDANLVNPWGISFSSSSPFWIADNGTGLSTLYTGAGVRETTVVTIPPPGGSSAVATPTGTVYNSNTNIFNVAAGKPAKFIFSTENGTVSGWNSGTAAVLEVDNSASGAVYKGLAMGSSTNGGTYLYAPDFHNGKVAAFDTNWNAATLPGSFTDTNIPAGFAPFNVQNIAGQLYVTYAMQDTLKSNDVAGPGHGYVDVFDTSGNLLQRLISQGTLNSPWGVALAPASFGDLGGDLLVGNFGDGRINAFNPSSGVWLDALNASNGSPFSVGGLWAIAFGNGGNGGSPNTLYFTAGIDGQTHGLIASLAPLFAASLGGASFVQSNLVANVTNLAAHTDTNLVNPWGISMSSSSPFWIADNGTGLSTLYNGAGVASATIVTIPPPGGSSAVATPTGTVYNSNTNFFNVATGKPAKFIFATENGTISGWNSGSAAVLEVDNSASGAVYKGLAIGTNSAGTYLYATDFHNSKVVAFNTNWNATTLPGSFTDTNIPAGFAPFNVQNLNGQLYVTYAKQDAVKSNDVAGPGNGYVDVFDTSGNLLTSLIAQGPLNSPWGVALAPALFGIYGGDLLVGNFGDGHINAFNPTTGAWIGPLYNASGDPFSTTGLWALTFGNGGSGGDPNTLYFTAGTANSGLLASLGPAAPTFISLAATNAAITLNWNGGGGPFQVQMSTNLSQTNWSVVLTTTNHTVTVTNTGGNAFFRVLNSGG